MNPFPNAALRVVRAIGLVTLALLLLGPVTTRLAVVPGPIPAEQLVAVAGSSNEAATTPVPVMISAPRSMASSVLRHRLPNALFLSLLLVVGIGLATAGSRTGRHHRETRAAPRPVTTRGLCRRGPPLVCVV